MTGRKFKYRQTKKRQEKKVQDSIWILKDNGKEDKDEEQDK